MDATAIILLAQEGVYDLTSRASGMDGLEDANAAGRETDALAQLPCLKARLKA